jgi:hypothetical protein
VTNPLHGVSRVSVGQVAEWFKAAVLKAAGGCEAALGVMEEKEGN